MNITLKDGSSYFDHVDYFFNPAQAGSNGDQEVDVTYYADKFLANISRAAANDIALSAFLATLGINDNVSSKDLDVINWATEQGFTLEQLKADKRPD